MSNQYTKDSIESLDPLQFTRLRPGVYCGSTEYSTQLVTELFSNALDEFNLGHGDKIEITISKDNIITVRDYGQGFLINEKREDGKTVLEAAFSVLNTSGKYRDDGVYEGTSLGLNGIGAKLATFLSHWTQVVTYKDGKFEEVNFKEGMFESRNLGTTDLPNGTKVTFNPSEEFFNHAEPDSKALEKMFNEICALCPTLTVVFNGKEIKHEEGISYLIEQASGEEIAVTDKLIFQEKKDKYDLVCGIQYSSKSSTYLTAYVNYGLTDAGPHITAVKSCITRTLNKWAKEQGLLKEKEKNLDGTSLQEGLVLIFNLVAPGISYDAQTKSRVVSNDFVPFLNEVFSQRLELWLDQDPEQGKRIIEKALVARRAAEAAKKARAAVKAKAVEKKEKKTFLSMPTTLVDCFSKKREETELFVVEGLSAASSLVAQRDGATQGVYSIRGMMLNVQKVAEEKIVQNKEINNLITALGLDYNPKNGKMIYDKKKLRYGKIIAASDADPARAAIENLLFNILWQLCPDLIIEGHVYSAEPPLFRATTKQGKYFFLKGEQELQEFKKHNNVVDVQRCKGLGEMMPEQLSECILDPKTRTITQLKVEDIGATDTLFSNLYGKSVAPRVKYIKENSWKANVAYE